MKEQQDVYIDVDSNASDEEDEDNNDGNSPPYGDNGEVEVVGGEALQPNDQH